MGVHVVQHVSAVRHALTIMPEEMEGKPPTKPQVHAEMGGPTLFWTTDVATLNSYPGLNYIKAVDENGNLVNFVADVDFAGSCENPRALPLRTRVLWATARHVDLANHFPEMGETIVFERSAKRGGERSGEGIVADAVIEAVKVICGRCRSCANVRKGRWMRATEGFLAGADLSLFYSLTFSEEYFNHRVKNAVDSIAAKFRGNISGLDGEEEAYQAQRQYFEHQLRKCVGFDATSSEHDAASRAFMCEDRQRMIKLLRRYIDLGRFQGAKLIGQMSLYEYGDTRGRLHLHGMMHFNLPAGVDRKEVFKELHDFIIGDWVKRGVGRHFAQNVQMYEQGTSTSTANYLLNYLLKYDEVADGKRVTKSRARLAASKGYRKVGTIAYYAAYPKLVPGGMLREVTPREVNDISMKAAAKREDWRYGDDVIMSVASQPAWARLKPEQRDLALQLARAAMIWNDGELTPEEFPDDGTAPEFDEDGEFVPDPKCGSGPEREYPPDPFEYAHWLQDQLRGDVEGVSYYKPELITEDGSDFQPTTRSHWQKDWEDRNDK